VVSFNWRWAFIATGMLGLVVAIIWFALYRDPDKSQMTEAERRYLDEGSQSAGEVPSKLTFAEWRGLFSYATTWGMLIGFFGSVYLNWVYLTWLPGYLTIERHMSLIHTGFAASVPFLCGIVGSLVAGWFSDLITRGSRSPVASRRNAVVVSMLGMMVFTIPAALVESNAIAVACISVVVFLGNAAAASSWALATAAAPPSRIASLAAIQNFGGFLGGALAPIATGFIAQASSFVPALLTAAGIAGAGAMAYLLLVRKPIPEQEGAAGVAHVPA
jgi:sugar phosphate permease